MELMMGKEMKMGMNTTKKALKQEVIGEYRPFHTRTHV